MHSAPPQREHVETTVDVRRIAVEQRCGAVSLRKHGGMPRPGLEIRQDAAEALKPAAQLFLVVALTTKRVVAGNAVMDAGRDCFHRLFPAMVVDVVERLSDSLLDD